MEFFKKATGTTGRHDLGDDLAHVAQNLLQHDPDFRATASSSRALHFSYRVRPDYTGRRKGPAYDYENIRMAWITLELPSGNCVIVGEKGRAFIANPSRERDGFENVITITN